MEQTLIIRHTGKDPDRFQVTRLMDGKGAPNSVEIPWLPNSNLSAELRWYLERFLDYPFHPDTDVAKRIILRIKREKNSPCFIGDSGSEVDSMAIQL